LKLLLRFTRTPSPGSRREMGDLKRQGKMLNALPKVGGARILDAMKTVSDPVIAAYALLESIAPLPFVWGQ
jgi:hypothetical protein